jgi:hypothetical protein
MKKKQIKKFNLICVAHPDDETIFFGGLILRHRVHPWRVVCVTNGNADGLGGQRKLDLIKACERLHVHDVIQFSFPDIYENRLDTELLAHKLNDLPSPQEIFTHGPLGEYGHPHHQDVCYATNLAFPTHKKLFSVAYNAFPTIQIELSKKEFAAKTQILSEIYGSETIRFLGFLPATFSEGFLKVDRNEVAAIYAYLTGKSENLNPRILKRFLWLKNFIKTQKNIPRPF